MTRRPITSESDLYDALTATDLDAITVDMSEATIGDLLAEQTPRKVRLCDYCGDRPAKGYVSAYRSHVCCECYEDHHGPTIDAEPIEG